MEGDVNIEGETDGVKVEGARGKVQSVRGDVKVEGERERVKVEGARGKVESEKRPERPLPWLLVCCMSLSPPLSLASCLLPSLASLASSHSQPYPLRPQPARHPSLPQPSRHLSHSQPYPLRPQPSRHPSLPQRSRHPPRVLTPPLTFTAPTLRSRASRALLELGNANKLHKIGSL